jgi:hypothetical protein
LDNNIFNIIFLDHDLSEEQINNPNADANFTGKAVAKYINKNADKFKDTFMIIHSLNVNGSESMESIIKDAGLDVIRFPFVWKNEKVLMSLGLI